MTVAEMVTEWQALRAELAAIERPEHPDIIDRFGRTWAWRSGRLYVHDQMAWTADMIARAVSLPPASLAANPNYHLCHVCTRDWPLPASVVRACFLTELANAGGAR